MRLSESFTLEELTRSVTAKNKGINNYPNNTQLINLRRLAVEVLQPLRNAYGKPIVVTSGLRVPKLNRLVGGAVNSQHQYGEAADITSVSDSPEDNKALFDLAEKLVRTGKIKVGQLIDEYGYNWVHISLPTSKFSDEILHIK